MNALVGLASDQDAVSRLALRWAVAALFGLSGGAVDLHELSEVHLCPEHVLYRVDVDAQTIGGQLHAIPQPFGQVVDERVG